MARQMDPSSFPKEISNLYTIKDTIGAGGFAKVKAGRHKITGEKVAIKIMEKTRLRETNDLPRASLEIKALKELIHPHISRLYQALETEDRFYIVLEYAPGGELFDYIVAKDRLKEDEARHFFRQIISAVAYMHSKGYVHRDLKPENLLLDADQSIKLIDFGLVGHSADLKHDMLKTCCGSAAYAAPELIRGERYIGPPADMWSLGILLYALLCGFLPFDDDDTQKLYRLIQRGTYEIPAWLTVGSQEIIAALLKHKADQRITMDDILRHPWVTNGGKLPPVDIHASYESSLDNDVVTEMAKFYGSDNEGMSRTIRQWDYDEVSVLYELLKQKHQKGSAIRLPANKSHLPGAQAMALLQSKASNLSLTVSSPAGSSQDLTSLSTAMAKVAEANRQADPARPKVVVTPVSHARPPTAPVTHSMPVSAATSATLAAPGSPGGPRSRPRAGTAIGGPPDDSLLRSKQFVSQGVTPATGLDKAGVVAQPMHGSHDDLRTSARARATSNAPVPQASGLRGSFHRLTETIKSAFGSSRNMNEPQVVKGLFSLSTTSTKDPRSVLHELLRVIHARPNVKVEETGYLVKVKVFNLETGKHEITLSFEVCIVHRMDITGIKLKRIKGDTWAYKKICKDLLQEARL